MREHVFGIGFRDAPGYRYSLVELLQVLVDADQAVHGVGESGISGQAQLVLGDGALLLACGKQLQGSKKMLFCRVPAIGSVQKTLLRRGILAFGLRLNRTEGGSSVALRG